MLLRLVHENGGEMGGGRLKGGYEAGVETNVMSLVWCTHATLTLSVSFHTSSGRCRVVVSCCSFTSRFRVLCIFYRFQVLFSIVICRNDVIYTFSLILRHFKVILIKLRL